MRSLLLIAVFCFLSAYTLAQKASVRSEMISPAQAATLFPDSMLQRFAINFPIYRVYKNADKTGIYYCLLTESRDVIGADKDTSNYQVKAVCLKAENGSFSKSWEINDKILKDSREEKSIWFWTKYTEFRDYDNDGLIDPVIVYGTSGSNGYDDGRIKFIIFYKGQKLAIRHLNGVLDFERETQVDAGFYALPAALQSAIKQKMELIMQNGQGIFPAGWQQAMKNKKLVFNERK